MLSVLGWFKSISKKFFQIVPTRTLVIIVLHVSSQIALILAFFLPLKVIILLGSTDMPNYFPPSWQALDKNALVITLSVSAALAYLFYVLAEIMVSQLTEKAALMVLKRKVGSHSVSKPEAMAKQLYARYVKIISSLTFIVIAVISIAFVYPELVLPMGGYCLFLTMMYLLGSHYKTGFKDQVTVNINMITSTLGAIGFMAMFGYMVTDFMVPPPPGVIQAVIGLLLVRQVFSRLVVFMVNLKLLYDKKTVVRDLFYQNDVIPESQESGK